jgi:hypothetical protein
MDRLNVVAFGDIRDLASSSIVAHIAREMRMSEQIVAREIVSARESLSRFTHRARTSVLQQETYAMSCDPEAVVAETYRRLARLEIEMPERDTVTWLATTATRATPRTYALGGRLDIDLGAAAQSADAEKRP